MADTLPTELRRIIGLSLKPSDVLVSVLNEERRQSPAVRELIEAILFSRAFVPAYLVVLVTSVVLWAILRWSLRQFVHGVATASSPPSSVASSSSSTLQGTESPPMESKVNSENTPLLTGIGLKSYDDRNVLQRSWHRLRSFLLHQPKPIPAATAAKNTLPKNETSLVVLLFMALNTFFLFYRMPISSKHAFSFADRAGILFIVNLPVLYVLAAKNNQPLGWITGWSYEGLNIFHRRLGELLTLTAVVHAVGMVIGFYQLLAPSGFTLWWYLTRSIIIFGVIAFVCYMAIYFTSVGYFRQSFYEVFLALHIFLQVAALVMLYFHHHNARPYVGAALVIWALDRGISRIASKTRPFIATFEIAKDGETVLVYCDIPLRQNRWRTGMQGGWHAGQHVFLSVPEMGIKHKFQAHPFTIASPAPSRNTSVRSWPLQLTIRAQDGFSRELLEYAKLHQHSRVLLDGPYSSSDVLDAVQKADRVCLIAGGSGIAVTYPFAWAIHAPTSMTSDIIYDRCFYLEGQKSYPSVTRVDGLSTEKFAHFWVRQDALHESWIKLLPASYRAESTAHDHTINSGKALDLVTHRFDTRAAAGEHRRPELAAELKIWITDKGAGKIDRNKSVCIVVSGPDGLVRDIQNAVAELVKDGWNVEVLVEKFGW